MAFTKNRIEWSSSYKESHGSSNPSCVTSLFFFFFFLSFSLERPNQMSSPKLTESALLIKRTSKKTRSWLFPVVLRSPRIERRESNSGLSIACLPLGAASIYLVDIPWTKQHSWRWGGISRICWRLALSPTVFGVVQQGKNSGAWSWARTSSLN